MTIRLLPWRRARTNRHARARRDRPAPGRGRGAHPTRAAGLRDRRPRGSGLPGGEGRACVRASPQRSSTGPRAAITINLAPASLRKEGSGFDLPIALAVLAASYQVPAESLRGHAVVRRARARRAPAACAGGVRRRGRGTPGRADAARLRGRVGARGRARGYRARRRAAPRPRRSRTSAASAIRPILRRPRTTSSCCRPCPTSPMCAARSARAVRSRSPPRVATTCCSPGRPARARRCSPGACRASCRCSTTRRRSR